ncbi:MAG TPA: hypothetical protein VN758_01890 [Solirubrobacterales bacterium]|nr:hypothetical protein [Solirubrobacterales bacterium]
MSPRPGKGAKAAASPKGYRRLLKWAALPITDRRWAAPLSAVALGFGLFVGVAIGPGAAGTFATGAAQIIEIPGFSGGADAGDGEGGSPSPSLGVNEGGGGGGGSIPIAEPALPSFAPIASSEGESEPSETKTPPGSDEPSPASEEPDAEEETLSGIVLHVNPAAASYTIAEPADTLDVVHAAKPPQPGAKVSVPVRLLANGTFAEAGPRTKSDLRTRASFSGVVTYVDPTPTAPAYTVSKRGVSVLVHVHPDPAGAAPSLPALGAFASVTVDIEKLPPASASASTLAPASASASDVPASPSPVAEPVPPVTPEETLPPLPTPPAEPLPAPTPAPSVAPVPPSCVPDPALPPPPTQPSAILWQRQVKAQGAPFTASDFAGIVEAVCPDSAQLLLSADDVRESGHDLLFAVPPTIDTAKLEVGQSVLATATIASDGALALTGLASDERAKGAEDAKAIQGDLVAKRPLARPRSSR